MSNQRRKEVLKCPLDDFLNAFDQTIPVALVFHVALHVLFICDGKTLDSRSFACRLVQPIRLRLERLLDWFIDGFVHRFFAGINRSQWESRYPPRSSARLIVP